MIQRLYLILRECMSGFILSLIVIAAITLSVIITGFFVLSGESVRNYITGQFSNNIAPDTIVVSPAPGKRVFLFEMRDNDRPQLDDRALGRIRSMPGVNRVYPVLPVDVPLQAVVSFMGYRYGTDLPALGVPLDLIKKDMTDNASRREWEQAGTGETGLLPVAVPLTVLRAYNESMGPANGLPRLSAESVMGLHFRLTVGRSSMKTRENPYETEARLRCFSTNIQTMALLIPENSAREINRRFSSKPSEYVNLYVKSKDHNSLLKVSNSIRKMGYTVEVDRGISKNILELQDTITRFTGIIVQAVALLAFIAAGFSALIAVFNRLDYYRILRTVGASWGFLTLSILVKYTLLGFTASLAGVAILYYGVSAIHSAMWLVPGITLPLPDRVFAIRFVVGGTLLPLAATVPALIFLRFRALNRD